MLQFLEKNYFWIILVVIIILMTIIGYVAERTDFGHRKVEKTVDKKKEKREKDRQDREKLKNSTLKINDVVYKDNQKENAAPIEEASVSEVNPLEEVPDELKAPLGDSPKEEKEVNLNVPIGDAIKSAQKSFVNGITETLPGVDEDLNAPLPEMKKDTPKSSDSSTSSDATDDENVWKF